MTLTPLVILIIIAVAVTVIDIAGVVLFVIGLAKKRRKLIFIGVGITTLGLIAFMAAIFITMSM